MSELSKSQGNAGRTSPPDQRCCVAAVSRDEMFHSSSNLPCLLLEPEGRREEGAAKSQRSKREALGMPLEKHEWG